MKEVKDWSRGYLVIEAREHDSGTQLFVERHVQPERYITMITVPGTTSPFIPKEEWRALAENSSSDAEDDAVILDGPISVDTQMVKENPPGSGIFSPVFDPRDATHMHVFATFWAIHEGDPLPRGYQKD